MSLRSDSDIAIDADRRFLFLLGSARLNGNTEALARVAASGLPPSAAQVWLRLHDGLLSPFVDYRHGSGSIPCMSENERAVYERTIEATDLVFVTPLYWYSVSASIKNYLDWWSRWLFEFKPSFCKAMAGKHVWAVTVHAGDDSDATPLIDTLERSAAYLGMTWSGALLANANRPGQILEDSVAVEHAARFFID